MKLHAVVPLLATSLLLVAQETAPVKQSLKAVRAVGKVSMQGGLNEGEWAKAGVATDFTVQWPEFGKKAALPTEVKVLYDNRYIYVGARMHHIKGKADVVKRLHRRDQSSNSDWFTVYIDSLRDRRSALGFAVNASGVQKDSLHNEDAGAEMASMGDTSWDGVWESEVSSDNDGWTAKLKIPFSLLRIKNDSGAQVWGINFGRTDNGRQREYAYWQMPPRGESSFVGSFPELTGLEGIRPESRREWVPYVSTQRKFETAENYDDRKWTNRAGLDARLGLGSHSLLDLAIRPDFGQVEVDQYVLNLSTVETFLPEKRPFFLEGADILKVAGETLFYSRRIGAGLYPPEPAAGESIIDTPKAPEINCALKYTAKFDSGLNIGVLGANISQEKARIRDNAGNEVKREVSPVTNCGIVRLQQAYGESGSYVGLFESHLRCATADGFYANVTALDGVQRTKDRSGYAEYVLTRSDRKEDGEKADGWRARLKLARNYHSGLALEMLGVNSGRGYDPNDLGFLGRSDEQRLQFTANQRWDKQIGYMRNFNLGLTGAVARDQAKHVFERTVTMNARTDLTNFVSIWGSLGYAFPVEDDRELWTFQDPVKKYLKVKTVPKVNLGIDSPGNLPWYVSLEFTNARDEGGSTNTTVFGQTIKPTSALELNLTTTFRQEHGERRFVPNFSEVETAPMAGLRRLNSFDQTLRISYALSPTLTIQAFSQWICANWHYRDIKYYVNDDYMAPGIPVGASPKDSISDRQWMTNLITRWEFRPGSTFFLVYTHGVVNNEVLNTNGSISPIKNLADLRHKRSDDVIQAKISWMFR